MTIKPRKRAGATGPALSTQFARADHALFTGFVHNPADPARRFTVELLLDGTVVATAYSDGLVAELAAAGIADGCYGFTVSLPEAGMAAGRVVEARLANVGTPVGQPIACAAAAVSAPPPQWGELRWVGGLRFDGWLALEGGGDDTVEIRIDELPVQRIRPSGWSHVEFAGGARPARRLDLHLPERFADGRVHRLGASVDGRSLTPEVLAFVAFDGGLEAVLAGLGRWDSERLRGALFDRLVPASLPFSAYAEWKTRFPPEACRPSALKFAVLMIGDHRADETVETLESQPHAAWTAISLPIHHGATRFDSPAALDFLADEAAECEIVLFCLAGTVFAGHALQALAQVFDDHPACRCVYPDIDIQMPDGSIWPLALPAFDRERMLEQGYAAHLFAVRRADALRAMQASATLYALFPQALAATHPEAILHLPGALAVIPPLDPAAASAELAETTQAHLGHDATVERGVPSMLPAVRVRRHLARQARVAIMIPTRNRAPLLSRCIDSIIPAAERCDADIVIIDNESEDPETLDFLADVASDGVDIIRVSGPFNFARINNIAAQQLDVEHLCLLNNDIEAFDDLWLSELLSRLADPDVGAVGAKLIWPSGIVQHAGVVLGPSFAACHAGNDRMDADPGYADMLNVARECSAVTAACLLVRRDDYFKVGGMDEVRFPVNFNDVDLCLKLRQIGRRIVFTPHAKMLHLESASRGRDEAVDRKARFERELRVLRDVWGEALMDDPYYSPLLSLDPAPFSALAWPPRNRDPRSNAPPRRVGLPSGF